MNKNRQIILENPFHPLDLSPHDLLAVYKRFQQSRLINRNPKHELSIESIAQLISSLKGCPPSFIHKCISQALIKETISWNEFLTFLDQESEVREKILEWLMYEKTTIKFKEEKQWPFRTKINKFYEEITFIKFVELNQSQKFVLCSIDKTQYYLFSENNGKLQMVDTFINKSERTIQEKLPGKNQQEYFSIPSTSKIYKNDSKFMRKGHAHMQNSKSMHKTEKSQRQKVINSLISSTSKMNESNMNRDQEQTFYRKERRNINSLFNVFKDLSLDNSITYAKIISQKISQQNLHPAQIAIVKDAYSGLQQEKVQIDKRAIGTLASKPLDKAKLYLKELHRQNKILSYNPYNNFKNQERKQFQIPKQKKLNKERKQREYSHLVNHQVYNPILRCLAIMYFNMELVLVKIARQYNKVSLEEQDKTKIATQNQHKKNQIIEGIDFYYHSIVAKWFLIILIRVQYKNQFRNENQSYIRGYEIQLVDKKGRHQKDYRFKTKKQTFTMPIQNRDKKSVSQETIKYQIFSMEMQTQYGIHFISVNGKYICFKEDYIQRKADQNINKKDKQQKQHLGDTYFTFYYQEKFKNSGLSLSCLSVGRELNKIVFGTIRGMIIVYDHFSHFFKIKKVSSTQISQIKILGSLAFILTLDQKLIVYDLVKIEEIQHLSIKNETKLHQKIKRFEINKNVIYFYGSEVRSYCEFTDEKLLHEGRKMQTLYKWRLNKLFKQECTFKKQYKFKDKELKQILPGSISLKKQISVETILNSENYFLVLTEILELIVVDKKSLKIKFTIILGIPHDSKVMKMALSMNQKLLALLLFNQNIFIFNIHTQDLYQNIKPSPYLKYTTICFLDHKNQYLLACGTQNGKIMLSPYSVIPQKQPKVLQFHKKPITSIMVAKKQYLVCCGQDLIITIWLLPFNLLKHEIRLNTEIGFVLQQIGAFREMVYLRSIEGNIVEINSHEGKLVKAIKKCNEWMSCSVDSCTGQLLGIDKNNNLEILNKIKDEWILKTKVKIENLKSEIKSLGVIQSEKAIIFLQSGMALPWSYQTQKIGKVVNLCQQ